MASTSLVPLKKSGITTRVISALKAAVKGWSAGNEFITARNSRNSYSRMWLSGTEIDYATLAGPMWTNSAVSACLLWMIRNFIQAPLCVYTKKKDGSTEIVPDHPLQSLFENPNPEYDGSVLMAGLLLSWVVSGNAYLLPERSEMTGDVKELWYVPHSLITPVRSPCSKNFIDYYEYYPDRGLRETRKPEDVIHLRFGVDPFNTMLGMSGLAALFREVFSDNEISNYVATIMANKGIMGAFVSPKESNSVLEFEPDEFVKMYQEKTTGDRRGEIFATEIPINIQFPDVKPDDMALTETGARGESRICAVTGVPAMVAGLQVAEGTKTYANYGEAREAGLEECIIPNGLVISKQLTQKVLQKHPLALPKEFLGFDVSNFRALQPDKDKLHQRAREDWKANLITRAEWKRVVGVKALPEDEGVYFRDIVMSLKQTPNDPNATDPKDGKAQREEVSKKWRVV